MSNKRIVWLSLFLTVSLYAGGFCYAFTIKRFPCKVLLSNHSFIYRLHFNLNFNSFASKMKEYAQQVGENPASWQGVVVYCVDGCCWRCTVHKTDPNGTTSLFQFLFEDLEHNWRTTTLKGSDFLFQQFGMCPALQGTDWHVYRPAEGAGE
jgi:hypothetical protein